MAEPKFTKGPWLVNKYRSIGAGEHGTEPIVAHIEPFYGDDRKYGDDEANARLISAAPDLYEALVDAKVTLEEAAKVLAEHYPSFANNIVNQCAIRCGDALAKAGTGQ